MSWWNAVSFSTTSTCVVIPSAWAMSARRIEPTAPTWAPPVPPLSPPHRLRSLRAHRLRRLPVLHPVNAAITPSSVSPISAVGACSANSTSRSVWNTRPTAPTCTQLPPFNKPPPRTEAGQRSEAAECSVWSAVLTTWRLIICVRFGRNLGYWYSLTGNIPTSIGLLTELQYL